MHSLPPDLQGAKNLKWAPYAGRNLTYFLTYMHLRDTYGKLYETLIGVRFRYIFVEAKDTAWQMFRAPAESDRLEKFVYEKCKDSAYVETVLEKTEKNCQSYRRHGDAFFKKDFSNADAKALAEALTEHRDRFLEAAVAVSCSIIFASALGKRLEEKVPQEALMTLAMPLHMTIPLQEEIEFWKLVGKLQENGIREPKALESLAKPLESEVRTHFDKYFWMDAYENDPAWDFSSQFQTRLSEALREDGNEKAAQITKRHLNQEEKIAVLSEKHGVDPNLLQQFRKAMYFRILGESILGYGNVATKPLFAAIAKKLYLPANQVKWFSDEELIGALKGEIDTEKLNDRLTKRQQRYLVALGEKSVHAFEGEKEVQAVLDQLDIDWPKEEKVSEVRGVSAYPGLVQGIARVVRNVGELSKVKQGDILVTLNTTPSFILAMKRSAAIVTDEGGITCHAAIVSRELGIPCIIGTKAGTRLIPDGSRIEVDAAKGTVKNLEA